jgi:uncharacterized protein YbjT (DUF2867 family)
VAAVLVAGGTGTLGRAVVTELLTAGAHITVASRRPRPRQATPYRWATVDYSTGAGLDEALDAATVVIQCTGNIKDLHPEHAIVDALRSAGGVHLVYVSIVGIDHIGLPYYRRKLAAERLITSSGVRSTILRATQFHSLVATICAGLTRLPVALAPVGVSLQPVDVRDVARHVVALGAGPPIGRAPDFGGPEVRTVKELVATYLQARGRQAPIAPLWIPGRVYRELQHGWQLVPDQPRGTGTFEEYLATSGRGDRKAST